MRSLPVLSILLFVTLASLPLRAETESLSHSEGSNPLAEGTDLAEGADLHALGLGSDHASFVENRGQWPDDVRFRSRLGGADVWITDDGLVYDFYRLEHDAEQGAPLPRPGRDGTRSILEREGPEAAVRHGHVVAMRFEGAQTRRAEGHGQKAAYHNYFLGDDPARWASHVPLYDEVVLGDLYEGIDLRLYAEGGLLRYDLVLAPGADLAQVRVRLDGADAQAVTPEGALRMGTSLGPVEHRGLLAYQEGSSEAREVVGSAFVLGAGGTLGFEVAGVDTGRGLVVDPLIWASFLGGASTDVVRAVGLGEDGSATVAGRTSSPDFPATPGAYDESHNGSTDAFVARLSADGSALEYATFLGGSGSDWAFAMAVGEDGSATVAGRTDGPGFPTTAGAYDETFNGAFDAFVVRLDLVLATAEAADAVMPASFWLSAAYPNPLRQAAWLEVEVAAAAVRVVVYDVLGREVSTLLDGHLGTGQHAVRLEASGLAPGTYLVRMTTDGGFSQTQRVTLMK